MKLLVTGFTGFVGGWISATASVDPRWNGIEILTVTADLLDGGALATNLTQCPPDAVIHLAALSSVAEAIHDPVKTAAVNVMGTLNLLDALEKTGFSGRFLFIGSSEEYGAMAADKLPVTETAPLAPRNPYAASKAAAEMFVLERARRGKLNAVCVRAFNHTGPRQDARFVLPSLARQVARVALGRQSAEILAGDLDITRDFLDVRDVVAAYLTLLQHGECATAYNVCSGQESRLSDLLDELQRLAGVRVVVKRDPAMLRPAEQRRVRGDATRLRALGWAPAYPMTQTLQSMLDEWLAIIEKEET
jgi:GDP-4-dehydro-6-deoxy-D-mannose reductase